MLYVWRGYCVTEGEGGREGRREGRREGGRALQCTFMYVCVVAVILYVERSNQQNSIFNSPSSIPTGFE